MGSLWAVGWPRRKVWVEGMEREEPQVWGPREPWLAYLAHSCPVLPGGAGESRIPRCSGALCRESYELHRYVSGKRSSRWKWKGNSFCQMHTMCKQCAGHSKYPRAVAIIILFDRGVNSGSEKLCDVSKIITQWWRS